MFRKNDIVIRNKGILKNLPAIVINPSIPYKEMGISGLMTVAYEDDVDLHFNYPEEAFKKYKEGDNE